MLKQTSPPGRRHIFGLESQVTKWSFFKGISGRRLWKFAVLLPENKQNLIWLISDVKNGGPSSPSKSEGHAPVFP